MPRVSRPRRGLLSWLSNATTPVFVLSERRVVLFFNRGCEQLTGWNAAELIGQVCEYASGGDSQSVASLTGRLCPPPEVLAGQSAQAPAELLHRDGTPHPRTIYYFLLQESADAAARIVGIIGPGDSESTADGAEARQRHVALAMLFGQLRREFGEHTLVGTSSSARRLREQVRVAAGCNASVHLHGEIGSGRRQLAQLIHQGGGRKSRAFVPLDCGRAPAIELKLTLRRLLSVDDQPPVEQLRAGTVLLESVGDLPRDIQEFLSGQREARSVAGWQLVSSDHRRLSDLRADERLLPEFIDLLSEIVIEVPPLRARRDDLPLLAQDILESLNRGDSRQVGGFSAEVWEQMANYDWPGNICELEAVIREAREACTTPLIAPNNLPFRFRTGLNAQSVGPSSAAEPVNLEQLLARVEVDYIRWALNAARSNKSQAAALLGLTRPRLYRRMETLGILDEDSSG
ncbi:MAG: sigma 54-interacting transcriptional regulator [Planctomycetaceae bacterium]|nr:sigma 54-interacting transcriptional regulator [Planctomycetaceae bacterium]